MQDEDSEKEVLIHATQTHEVILGPFKTICTVSRV